MAATGLQANWDLVKFNNVQIKRVTQVQVSQGGSVDTFFGDFDHFPTVAVAFKSTPRVTLVSGDIAALNGFTVGQQATFTAKHLDAQAASGGAIVWTLANATIENVDGSGSHGTFGSGNMSMIGVSSDGTTNPLSFTRV